MSDLNLKLSLLPTNPGCYLMKNKDGVIIYVGKAKNLKRRVNSYFNKTQTGKTKKLVSVIYDFDYIITNTEVESLILEINLIKKYNPKYNILLKDDKTYPYIELITNPYPILKIVRLKNRNKIKDKLYGPYPNVSNARETVDLLNRLYPLRKCKTMGKNYCLYYHIGECLGYCRNIVSKQEIDEMVKEISSILNGNYKLLEKTLNDRMIEASQSLNYEKALEYKNEIESLKKTINKQIIVSNKKYNFDVFNYFSKDNYLIINTLMIRNGIIMGSCHEIFPSSTSLNDFMQRYVINFYEKYPLPKKIVVPQEVGSEVISSYLNIECLSPKKGDIKKILDMSLLNATIILNENLEKLKKDKTTKEYVIESLKNLLSIDDVSRIELFDNSHLFGTNYVGAMVVYENLEKQPKEYRKYKLDIKTKDDISAMKEVIYRRYYRCLVENLSLPNLIIVDGGKLQVLVAKEVIDSLNLKIKIIGLAKDDKHRTSFIVDDNLQIISLENNNKLLLYLTKMQDEVHRFVISYHRDLRSKNSISSLLLNVSGIGEKRKKELLKRYNSISKIKEAPIDELKTIIPEDVAKNLKKYLEEVEKSN